MIATKHDYAARAALNRHIVSRDHMRYCSVCGTQRPTERGRFVAHQKPNSKPGDPDCENSGQSVNKVNQEAQG